MTQELIPEIQTATDALQAWIAITETIIQLKETIVFEKELLKTLRKALAPFGPRRPAAKKRAVAS